MRRDELLTTKDEKEFRTLAKKLGLRSLADFSEEEWAHFSKLLFEGTVDDLPFDEAMTLGRKK